MEEDAGSQPDDSGGVLTGGEAAPVRWWQVAIGILGWIVAALLVAWFVIGSSGVSVQVAAFLISVAVVIALTTVIIAVQLLRPPLMRTRLVATPLPAITKEVDSLGRTLRDPSRWQSLSGELTMVEDASGRHPLPVQDASP